MNLYRLGLDDVSSTPDLLLPSPVPLVAHSFAHDSGTLVLQELHPDTGRNILFLPLDGRGQTTTFAGSTWNEKSPVVSPDGNWVAYGSDQSGSDEVYLRSVDQDTAARPSPVELPVMKMVCDIEFLSLLVWYLSPR